MPPRAAAGRGGPPVNRGRARGNTPFVRSPHRGGRGRGRGVGRGSQPGSATITPGE